MVEACDSDNENAQHLTQWVWDVPLAGVFANDNVDGDVSSTMSVEPTSFDTRIVGTMDIMFFAHDHAGMFGIGGGDNSGNLTTSIAVVDTTPPMLYCSSNENTIATSNHLRDAIAASATISQGSGHAENFAECCGMCETQQWERRVGKSSSAVECGSVNYDPITRSCVLKSFKVTQEWELGTASPVVGALHEAVQTSEYGYPIQCQVTNTVECDRNSNGLPDPGVRCIDFHDSLNLDLPAPHIDDTALGDRVTVTGEGDLFHCVGGAPYEIFGPGDAPGDHATTYSDAHALSHHDLDHKTIKFERCGGGNWRFKTTASTDSEIADTGCNSCGTKLGLDDDHCTQVSIGEFFYFGESYTSVHVCADGYVHFGDEYSSYYENVADFIQRKMIAALWDDFDPGQLTTGGTTMDVKDVYHQTEGHLEKFRWHMLPQYQRSGANTFMLTLDTSDFSVSISHNHVDSVDGLVGLSSGSSVAGDHIPVNFATGEGSEATSDTLVLTGAIKATGTFSVKYTCSDAGNLEATATRAFQVIDSSPPTLSLVGSHTVEFAYWQSAQHFADIASASSATCEDSCDGTLIPDVLVYEGTCGGPHICHDQHGQEYTCNPEPIKATTTMENAAQQPGVWAIKYSCEDSLHLAAVPQCRTVINEASFMCRVSDWEWYDVAEGSGWGGQPGAQMIQSAAGHKFYRNRTITQEPAAGGTACPHLAEYYDQLPGPRAGLFVPGYTAAQVNDAMTDRTRRRLEATGGEQTLLDEWMHAIQAAHVEDAQLALGLDPLVPWINPNASDAGMGWHFKFLVVPRAPNSETAPGNQLTGAGGRVMESVGTDGVTKGVDILIGASYYTADNTGATNPPTLPSVKFAVTLSVRGEGHAASDISSLELAQYKEQFAANIGDAAADISVVKTDDNGAAIVTLTFVCDNMAKLRLALGAENQASARTILLTAVGSDHTQAEQFVWPLFVELAGSTFQLGIPVDCVWGEFGVDGCDATTRSCSTSIAIVSRPKLVTPVYGGAFCEGWDQQLGVCPATVFNCTCYTSYTEWTTCPICGTGLHRSTRDGLVKHDGWEEACAESEEVPCNGDGSVALCTAAPTARPTVFVLMPTDVPTSTPTARPTYKGETLSPTGYPSAFPSAMPTSFPTSNPTITPTTAPSEKGVTNAPSWSPTPGPPPTDTPTMSPTKPGATHAPTSSPSYPVCETPVIEMVGDTVSMQAGQAFVCNGLCDCEADTGPPNYDFVEPGVNCSSQHGSLGVVSTWTDTGEADAKELGVYEITYTCTSITDCGEESFRSAAPLVRTVLVTYTDDPHCHEFGKATMNVEADFPYVDPGACFFDGHLGKIASTEVNQLPVITEPHDVTNICDAGGAGGSPYELFGPGGGKNDMNTLYFDHDEHNYHDLDHTTIQFKLCDKATQNWGFNSATSTDEEIADVGCSNCGDKLGLSDDSCVVRSISEFDYFGATYSTVHVCANGFLQFGAVDGETIAQLGERSHETPHEFVTRKMIAGIWDDLNPGHSVTDGKDVFHETVGELEKFRWHMLPEFTDSGANTLMITINTTEGGDITISHNNITATDGLVGLSSGSGSLVGHVASNFATGTGSTSSNPTEAQRLAAMYQSTKSGDGFLTTVNTTANVDTSNVGTYYVTYTVVNPMPDFAQWATHSCVRTVNVIDTLKPVISIVHQGYHIQPDTTPDQSTADVPYMNPAQHFAQTPGTREAVDYDTLTELGQAPYLVEQAVVASYSECQQSCENTATCTYGTYITAGLRAGECWLAATTSKLSRPCGVPCKSFIVVDDQPNTQFRRRLTAMLRGGTSREGVVGSVATLGVAALGIVALVVAIARKQASGGRIHEEWTAC
jgi:hypothetical protein